MELDADANIDDVANSLLSKIGDDGAPPAGDTANTDATSDEPSGDDVAKVEQALDATDDKAPAKSKEAKGADTETTDEAEEPAKDDKSDAQAVTPIDPPVSWKAEEKERFKALPPETQKYLVDRENEREAVLTNANKEKATAIRAQKSAEEAVQRDRNLYASNIDTIIAGVKAGARQLVPMLAEGDRLSQNNGEGWRLLEAQDPTAAKVKWADYLAMSSQLDSQLSLIGQEAQKTRAAQTAEAQRRDQAALKAANDALSSDPDLGPVWSDDAKRVQFQSDFKKFLTSKGFEESFLDTIRDPRVFTIGKLAMERASQSVPYEVLQAKAAELDKIKAQQAQIASKKVPAQQGRVLKPQAADDGDAGDDKMKAALKKARNMNVSDAASVIANAL